MQYLNNPNPLHRWFNTCIENFPEQYWTQHGPVCVRPIPSPYKCLIQFTIKIPRIKADFETIHRLISKTLGKIESLKAVYDNCCWRWHTEYSSPHIGDTLSPRDSHAFQQQKKLINEAVLMTQFINHMGVKISYFLEKNIKNQFDLWRNQSCRHECAAAAAKKYPHNAINWNEYFEYHPFPPPISLSGPRLWGQYQIRYFQDETTTFVEIVPMKYASRSTFSDIYMEIRDVLNDQNLLWESRKAYVSLLEGISFDVHGSIPDYLLDEYVCRDICSYRF
jgi:hypothetical protein